MAVIDHSPRSGTAAFPALLVARVVGTAMALRRAIRNRRMFHRLREMTDRELADVGIRRSDLHEAWRRRVELDPTAYLNQIARSRSSLEGAARRIY
ncbi:MAG TPA: DUF1127 domain-containing protein [Rhizobiaceae bacterium]|nr:DUF1127 domain-containing protein [Rhizobiaceae bacterium]